MSRLVLRLGLAVALAHGADAAAQDVERISRSLLDQVMPGAERFDPAEGDPPVKRAYRGEELLGFVFVTSDVPPEEFGYSGPIRAVVGVSPEGVLTGMRVTDYRESYMSSMGDFLREPPWFQDQFAGKHVGDRFRAGDDIDGIAQVSISVRALALGVRGAARRVAAAHAGETPSPAALTAEELSRMTWYDMRRRGVAATVAVESEGRPRVDISLIHLPSEDFAQHLVGNISRKIPAEAEKRGGADLRVLYVVQGTDPRVRPHRGWSIEQGGRTVEVPDDDVVGIGSPGGGVLLGESGNAGVILLDGEDVDITRPLTFVFTGGRADTGPFRASYTSQAALARIASASPATTEPVASPPTEPQAASAAAPSSSPVGAPPSPPTAAPAPADAPSPSPADAPSPSPAAVAAPSPAAAAAPSPEQVVQFDFTLPDDESADEGLLGANARVRMGWIVLVLVLATLAFLTKLPALRWLSLATTLVVLGWIDGGFLSISHVTGVIWVGSAAILRDPPLFIMVAFTLVTLLVWGRFFCGFLCPFGALQDFIDRFAPKRFKRQLPKRAHAVALKAKYVVLGVILIPAIAGVQASLYQYFEPFGTVFFVSRSALLWAIALSILAASAIVPRFYCRYVCPLGAALALGSLVSFRRVPRVEQCGHCKVCEHRCPTGAIHGPALDFKECVRCNDCEIQLIRRTGVCRHDMELIRPRLIQVQIRGHTRHEPPPLIGAR